MILNSSSARSTSLMLGSVLFSDSGLSTMRTGTDAAGSAPTAADAAAELASVKVHQESPEAPREGEGKTGVQEGGCCCRAANLDVAGHRRWAQRNDIEGADATCGNLTLDGLLSLPLWSVLSWQHHNSKLLIVTTHLNLKSNS